MKIRILTVMIGLVIITGFITPSAAASFSTWSMPQNMGTPPNSAEDDMHVTISPSGLSLYFSSNRPGGLGGTDIYVSQRATLTSAWGAPQNLGATINSSAGDGVTSFSRDGRTAFMYSSRPGGLGGSDHYIMTRTDPNNDFGWSAPVNLAVINSASGEIGSTYFEDPVTGAGTLIFNSNRPGGVGLADFYQSTRNADGTFNAPTLITELSSPAIEERGVISRDGLEIFITTNRPGVLGMSDIYVSTRASTTAPWNAPVPVEGINTASNEFSPTLSANGTTMYFSSNRAGGVGLMDLYSATRLVTTATGVEVSGRVTAPGGAGLRNARVWITDSKGSIREVLTSSFGYFSFDNIAAGETYVIGVNSKRYRFNTRTIQVFDTLADVDFSAME
ncbi:MAG: carboxypeptidase regulatory-like domain-containing protein [Pyrinomonadaceae bacterium]